MDENETLEEQVEEELDELDEEENGGEASARPKPKRAPAPKIVLTASEQHRLAEVLLYCYFNRMDESVFGTAAFWGTINQICEIYGLDSLCVSKSLRLLLVDTNRPTDLEMWYLLDKTKHSVRQIKNISGVYWQKQKKFAEEIIQTGTPAIQPKINDPALRKGIKDFLFAMYGICGIFQFTDAKTLKDALC